MKSLNTDFSSIFFLNFRAEIILEKYLCVEKVAIKKETYFILHSEIKKTIEILTRSKNQTTRFPGLRPQNNLNNVNL